MAVGQAQPCLLEELDFLCNENEAYILDLYLLSLCVCVVGEEEGLVGQACLFERGVLMWLFSASSGLVPEPQS